LADAPDGYQGFGDLFIRTVSQKLGGKGARMKVFRERSYCMRQLHLRIYDRFGPLHLLSPGTLRHLT
jgi:hypothetical protein